MPPSELDPPRASYLGTDSGTTPATSTTFLPKAEQDSYDGEQPTKKNWKKRPLVWIIALAALVVVVLAVILPVYFTVIKDKDSSSSSSSSTSGGNGGGNGNGSGGNNDPDTDTNAAVTGGDGSTITLSDGSTFVYENKFGGYCACSSSQIPQLFSCFLTGRGIRPERSIQ